MKLWQTFLLMIQKLNTLMKTINKAVIVLSVVCKWNQKILKNKDASLVAGWQSHVDLESVKEHECSDTDIASPPPPTFKVNSR
jgi:hypothetical protein